MPGQGFSGLAGLNRFRLQGANPNYGYWDTYGAGILPGGRLQASPSNTGQARSLPGVDLPVVGYPDTGWNPNQRLDYPYTTSVPGAGLPLRTDTGGLQPFDPLGYGANPPPNERVSPSGTRFYTTTPGELPSTTGSYGVPLQPFSSGDSYPDSPVTNPSFQSADYPIPGFTPGVGYTGSPTGNLDWQGNAKSGYGFAGRLRGTLGRLIHGVTGTKLGVTPGGSQWFKPLSGETWLGGGITGTDPFTGAPVWNPLGYGSFDRGPGMNIPQSNQDVGMGSGGLGLRGGLGGGFTGGGYSSGFSGGFLGLANAIASRSGFGSGLLSSGGGFQSVSEVPTFSGFAAPVGRAMAGPLQP